MAILVAFAFSACAQGIGGTEYKPQEGECPEEISVKLSTEADAWS